VLRVFEAGDFVIGRCLLEVPVGVDGRAGEVQILRPEKPSPLLVSAISRDSQGWRFQPAMACGHAIPSVLTMTITHCPVK
jgi:hypothetical protein